MHVISPITAGLLSNMHPGQSYDPISHSHSDGTGLKSLPAVPGLSGNTHGTSSNSYLNLETAGRGNLQLQTHELFQALSKKRRNEAAASSATREFVIEGNHMTQ